MISRVCLVNNFGFFTYLKDRYNMEKVFHLLNKLDVQQLDDNKKLEFQKKLILLRNDIDGKDRLGIQAIRSYLDYLSIQEKQLSKVNALQSNDHIFYKNISDKCADVDLIRQATYMSKIFYYLNGGDIKLFSLQLEFDLLIRKIYHSEAQDQFEKFFLKARIKDVLDKLVNTSDNILIQTLAKQYLYHLNNSKEYMNEGKYQEALDELVVSQTQLNKIWSKKQNKDDFRVYFQRLIIQKLVITAKAKYLLKQSDGLQIILDAINNYVDNLGIDEDYQEFYFDIVKFLHNLDLKGCLLALERLHYLELNLKKLELVQIQIITLLKLEQLKTSDLDKMIELYQRIGNQNEATEYEYNLFFYDIKNQLDQYDTAFIYLEKALKKLLLQSPQQQGNQIIMIVSSIQLKYLIQSSNAQQIFNLIMQISEKSCFRLKYNFDQLSFEEQLKTINTERIIITIQAQIDILSFLSNNQNASYQKTFDRLQYLDDQFQANQQLRFPILEILKDFNIDQIEIYEKINSLRQIILDTEILK